MASDLIKLDVQHGLARMTLANPATGNAVDGAMLDALAAAATALARARPRAVLLRAEGKNFCVGGDLRAMYDAPDRRAIIGQMVGRLNDAVSGLAALDAPVIAAVQGAAAGAGFSLAIGADIVLAGHTASFSLAYTGIGFSPDGGGSYYLPRLVGLRKAQELAFLNRALSAEEALQWGLITKLVDDAELDAQAEIIAQKIAAGPTLAFGVIKQLFASAGTFTLDQQLAAEGHFITETIASADGAEGLAAFIEHRPAKFIGA